LILITTIYKEQAKYEKENENENENEK